MDRQASEKLRKEKQQIDERELERVLTAKKLTYVKDVQKKIKYYQARIEEDETKESTKGQHLKKRMKAEQASANEKGWSMTQQA